jgi:hypothetical protein
MLFCRRLAGPWLALVLLVGSPASAQTPFKAEGLGPDAQLTGGGGLSFGGKLENHFLARVRAGALYARQPWIANLGATVELGALAGFGVGGEFELNIGGGFFGNVGVARVEGDRWLSHLGLGFMIFGLEWQHRYAAVRPSDTLMLFVRMPLGIWWLRKRQDDAAEAIAARAARSTPSVIRAAPDTVAPEPDTPPPSAAEPAARPEPETRAAEVAAALGEAQSASERGDHAGAALALARAYALRPDAQIALQLSAAEEASGKWRAAVSDLERARAGLASDAQAAATQHIAELKARMPQLRLTLEHAAGDEQVAIDGALEPSALLGYDVALDPGPHLVTLTRNGVELSRRELALSPGTLTRLQLDVAAP